MIGFIHVFLHYRFPPVSGIQVFFIVQFNLVIHRSIENIVNGLYNAIVVRFHL